jgi:hypothetical protein
MVDTYTHYTKHKIDTVYLGVVDVVIVVASALSNLQKNFFFQTCFSLLVCLREWGTGDKHSFKFYYNDNNKKVINIQ